MSLWRVHLSIVLIGVTTLMFVGDLTLMQIQRDVAPGLSSPEVLISTCIAGVALTAVIEADDDTVNVLYDMLKDHRPAHHVHTHEKIQPKNIKVTASIILAISTCQICFSALLIVGIKIHEPVLLALYLGYGMLVTILAMTCGLLVLLGYSWYASMVAYMLAIIYMFSLVKVYNGYESMCRADVAGDNTHRPLDEASI